MSTLTLNEWCAAVHAVAHSKGFHEEREIEGVVRDASAGERLALIASEVGEAVQALQRSPNPAGFYFEVDGKPEGVASEIADIVIRCFDFAEHYGIDLERVVETKNEFNRQRPHRHGGKTL